VRFLGAAAALFAANGCGFAAPLIAKSAIDALLGSDVPAVTRWLLGHSVTQPSSTVAVAEPAGVVLSRRGFAKRRRRSACTRRSATARAQGLVRQPAHTSAL
jgi:hypothetical protein